MRLLFSLILAAGLALSALPALAAGGDSGGGSTWDSSSRKVDPDFDAGRKAAAAEDFGRAVPLLQKAVATDPKNADAFNLLGYSLRKSGNLDAAFAAYEKALTLDPKHKGAHEYIGEAYLQAGNLAKAEEHLVALDDICFFGCDEYEDLKQRIADFKAGKTAAK